MFITATEMREQYGGKKEGDGPRRAEQALPFDCCALSLRPFSAPVVAPDGAVFDLLVIVPWLRKHGTHPITSEPLAPAQLRPLHFHRNAEGAYHCPVTRRVFGAHTKITAILTTGNVYAGDAVDRLCLKARNFRDLLTDEPFDKAKDVLVLQDPAKPPPKARLATDTARKHAAEALALRRAEASKRREAAGGAGAGAAAPSASGIRMSSVSARALAHLAQQEAKDAAKKKRERVGDDAAPDAKKSRPSALYTTGAQAASLTSTGVSVSVRNDAAAQTLQEANAARWTRVRAKKLPAYVRLDTSLGPLNLCVEASKVPMTAENFVGLCRAGAYDGTTFHRLIPGFMVQGGDPTGTGTGGRSFWGGKPFADEFDRRLRHDARGTLSMANAGPNSNRQQFFITFKPTPHLDDKHTVFGRVVGGMATLDAIEAAAVGAGDKPKEPIVIRSAAVFQDPFAEVDAAIATAAPGAAHAAEREAAKAAGEEETEVVRVGDSWQVRPKQWRGADEAPLSAVAPAAPAGEGAPVVGRYMKAAATAGSARAPARVAARSTAGAAAAARAKKRAPTGTSFGNFDDW